MPPELPVPEGKIGWDDLTAIQQSNLLAYHQVVEHDRSEWEIALAGGKSKPSSQGESRVSEAQRQVKAAANKG